MKANTTLTGLSLGLNNKEIIKIGEDIFLEYHVTIEGHKRMIIKAPKNVPIERLKKLVTGQIDVDTVQEMNYNK
jgi:sRNA-binding carbon storage regulator CsrA